MCRIAEIHLLISHRTSQHFCSHHTSKLFYSCSKVYEAPFKMSIYDEIEIEDMIFHEATSLYTYPCPCGDQFEILLQDLRDGEDVAVCPSCSLMIKVIFEAVRCIPLSNSLEYRLMFCAGEPTSRKGNSKTRAFGCCRLRVYFGRSKP